jgi:hypothetical protein
LNIWAQRGCVTFEETRIVAELIIPGLIPAEEGIFERNPGFFKNTVSLDAGSGPA